VPKTLIQREPERREATLGHLDQIGEEVLPTPAGVSRHAHVLSGLVQSSHWSASNECTLSAVRSVGVAAGDIGTHCPACRPDRIAVALGWPRLSSRGLTAWRPGKRRHGPLEPRLF
jgi:hypothetical protein